MDIHAAELMTTFALYLDGSLRRRPRFPSLLVGLLLLPLSIVACRATTCAADEVEPLSLRWTALPQLPDRHGVAGPFVGVHDDALIVAGGANFPDGVPWHPTSDGKRSLKRYHDTIHVLIKESGDAAQSRQATEGNSSAESSFDARYRWLNTADTLPEEVAYGVSIPTARGIICIGGERQVHRRDEATREVQSQLVRSSDVYLLRWDPRRRRVDVTRKWVLSRGGEPLEREFPDLPVSTTAACGALVGEFVYVLGGDTGEGGSRYAWRLDLRGPDEGSRRGWNWEALPPWDGPPRSHAVAVEQAGCLFLFSGRNRLEGRGFEILVDAHRFDPRSYDREVSRAAPDSKGRVRLPSYADGWRKLADIAPDGQRPRCVMAGTGYKIGHDDILIFGGAAGDVLVRREEVLAARIQDARDSGDETLAVELTARADSLYDDHQGFSRDILGYNVTTDTWTHRGRMPTSGPVTTTAAAWGDSIVIPSGEKRPGVRTRDVWRVEAVDRVRRFGAANWGVLIGYLSLLVGIGFYFSRREKSENDFFLAGGRIPWWAAGMSIFATMLSAITYLSIPARTYGTNWSWFILNMGIPVVAVIVVIVYLPYFRRIRAASAYEFLERRFHVSLRVFGSTAFVLFQLGRMGIVVLLPALALSAVTGIDVHVCVVAMGLLSTLYTVLGGIEAVVWTDVVQVVVLIGGAVAALFIMAAGVEGGWSGIVSTAAAHGKLALVDDFRFHDLSWSGEGILVILLGAVFTNLLPYTSDQAIVQRYLTVSTEAEARRAIWTNAVLTVPASILFFFVGTALWVFYRSHPDRLAPLDKADQIFPWFIAEQMPPGLAGLVIAGVFAAAMSSLDSSMHSIATAVTTDFHDRFGREKSPRQSLRFARVLTVLLGLAGTASALLLANLDIKYLWDLLLAIVGMFLGTLSGLFTLGIFCSRATALHAWLGVVASVAMLAYCRYATDVNALLNGAIAVGTCLLVGIVASRLIPVGQD